MMLQPILLLAQDPHVEKTSHGMKVGGDAFLCLPVLRNIDDGGYPTLNVMDLIQFGSIDDVQQSRADALKMNAWFRIPRIFPTGQFQRAV
jgi:hypothetical protein